MSGNAILTIITTKTCGEADNVIKEAVDKEIFVRPSLQSGSRCVLVRPLLAFTSPYQT